MQKQTGSVIPVSIEVRAAESKSPATAFFFSGFAVLYMARAAPGRPKIINGNLPDMKRVADTAKCSTVGSASYAGTWVYGFLERLLLPFGLHHVFYLPFWQTALGGTMEVGGTLIEGAQNIFFAQLADPTVEHVDQSAGE